MELAIFVLEVGVVKIAGGRFFWAFFGLERSLCGFFWYRLWVRSHVDKLPVEEALNLELLEVVFLETGFFELGSNPRRVAWRATGVLP